MTLTQFIEWLGKRRVNGYWHITRDGELRNSRLGYDDRCPLQVLTGREVGYAVRAREKFGLSLATVCTIMLAADTVSRHQRTRRRLLQAVGLA